jgi:hypothetical protein
MTWANVAWASHDVAQNTFKVTQVTPTSKSVNSHSLDFKVDAKGKKEVVLSTWSLSADLGSYSSWSIAWAVVNIYQDNNFVWSGSLTLASGNTYTSSVALGAYATIAKDTSATYEVRINGLTLNPSTNESWTVRLTELTASGGLSASSYKKNTETLPLISTK